MGRVPAMGVLPSQFLYFGLGRHPGTMERFALDRLSELEEEPREVLLFDLYGEAGATLHQFVVHDQRIGILLPDGAEDRL